MIIAGVADLGARRGYDRSHVITPYVYALTSVEQRASLARFARYQPHEPIVWRRAGRGLYWQTLKRASLEDELVKLARRRERGLRQSIATMARWTGSTPELVTRVLRSLVARGLGMLTVERGRFARATFRLVAKFNPATSSTRAAGLSDELVETRDPWAVYSPEERAKLEADAYAWRSGLAMSLAAVGFTGPDAEREYLELVAGL